MARPKNSGRGRRRPPSDWVQLAAAVLTAVTAMAGVVDQLLR
ncbi:hypothetical protein AB0F13_05790 [Streptomyces sp. NPDC026206]